MGIVQRREIASARDFLETGNENVLVSQTCTSATPNDVMLN